MKKLLITGFEPFGEEKINPSWEAVSRLPDEINGYHLTKLCLPVVFSKAAEQVIFTAESIKADIIICVGQAAGRREITPELVGINLRYAKIPDNQGNKPQDLPIYEQGESAYFSTLPVRRMVEAMNEIGVSASVSYSAGAYVCNDVLYTSLAHFEGTQAKVGFVHVPFCEEQGKEPSMKIDCIVDGLMAAIEVLD